MGHLSWKAVGQPQSMLKGHVVEYWAAIFKIIHTIDKNGVEAMEATCPYHRLGKNSGCKKRVNVCWEREHSRTQALQALRWWCNHALRCNRQATHVGVQIYLGMTLPSDAVMVAEQPPGQPPGPGDLLTDAELNAMEALLPGAQADVIHGSPRAEPGEGDASSSCSPDEFGPDSSGPGSDEAGPDSPDSSGSSDSSSGSGSDSDG